MIIVNLKASSCGYRLGFFLPKMLENDIKNRELIVKINDEIYMATLEYCSKKPFIYIRKNQEVNLKKGEYYLIEIYEDNLPNSWSMAVNMSSVAFMSLKG